MENLLYVLNQVKIAQTYILQPYLLIDIKISLYSKGSKYDAI